jgi:hypothetical protein
LLVSPLAFAQEINFVTYNESFPSTQAIEQNAPLRIESKRKTNSQGAKINIIYSSVVPDSLKQAIEVATHLWEDILPPEANIIVDVSIAPKQSDMSVTIPYINQVGNDTLYAKSYFSTYINNEYNQLYDGYIVFSNAIQWCCQSTQGYNVNKKCIATAMLRAIARTLGFGSTVMSDENTRYIYFTKKEQAYSPFDYLIYNDSDVPLSSIPVYKPRRYNEALSNYYDNSDSFWLKTKTMRYQLYAPHIFEIDKSMVFLDDPTCLMHYEMPTGSNYLNIDSKTIKILKAIGWKINVPSSVEIYSKSISSMDVASVYNPYLFEIDSDDPNISPLRWEYQVKSANGVFQTVYQQTGSQMFSVNPSEYLSTSHVNSSGIIDAIVCLTYRVNNEVKTTSMSLKLDCAPIILSITDQAFHFERYETLYDYSFNVSYRGATSITIGVEQEYSSFYDIIHIHEPNLAHAFIQALSRGNMVWIDISVTNEYGTVTETIEIPCQTNVHNVYNSSTSSENVNLCSRENVTDYIDIYSTNGSFMKRIKSISELSDIHSRTVILQYFNQNHKLTKTRKVNLK